MPHYPRDSYSLISSKTILIYLILCITSCVTCTLATDIRYLIPLIWTNVKYSPDNLILCLMWLFSPEVGDMIDFILWWLFLSDSSLQMWVFIGTVLYICDCMHYICCPISQYYCLHTGALSQNSPCLQNISCRS